MSEIEWTDKTWNPIVGCTRHSAACDNCYAIKMATRLATTVPQYMGTVNDNDWTGLINRAPDHIFNRPLNTRKPTVWFVNSMSDLFHDQVSDRDIIDIFAIMNKTPQHFYQLLTKRPARMLAKARALKLTFTDNIWVGASVGENKFARSTVRELAKIKSEFGASVIFISAEPLIGPLPDLDVAALDWVIVGGESGNSKTVRPMEADWARDLRDRCADARTPFFFKQWGSFGEDGQKRGKSANGHELDGQTIYQMPARVIASHPAPSPLWTTVDRREVNDKRASETRHEKVLATIKSGGPEKKWGSVIDYQFALIEDTPRTAADRKSFDENGEPPRVRLRKAIRRMLARCGELDVVELRHMVLANADLDHKNAWCVNQHAWALVDLQEAGLIERREEQKEIEISKKLKDGRVKTWTKKVTTIYYKNVVVKMKAAA